jgi:ribonuclease BN (tRNA processing enzyme)
MTTAAAPAAKVVLLGTGTVHPSAERASAGLALLAEGRCLPIDLGRGVLQRLCEHGVDPLELEALHLSHWHPDHCCDLVPLLFALRYAPNPPRSKVLTITAPPGFAAFLERLYAAWRWLRPQSYELIVREDEGSESRFGSLRLRTALLRHGDMPNLGLRIETAGKTLVYSGDSGPCEALLTLARGAHILVAECSLPAGTGVHMDPAALGRLATEAAVDELIVTHVFPPLRPSDMRRELRRHYGGSIRLGRDHLLLSL